jgi:cell division transport system permease protein
MNREAGMRPASTEDRIEIVAPPAAAPPAAPFDATYPGWRAVAAGLAFAVAEGADSFRRNGLMSAAAVVMIFVTLLALGGAILTLMNLNRVAAAAEEQVLAVAYLRDGMTAPGRAAVEQRARALDGVADVRFVPRAEALARLERSLGGRVNVRDVVRANPLPDSLEVRPRRPSDLRSVAAALRGLSGIADVVAGEEITGRIDAASRFVRVAGGASTAVLAGVAIVIILNTLRLTIAARRTEIEIMRLVGATSAFIRRPLFVEGMIQGGVAAAGAVVLLAAGYGAFVARASEAWPFLRLVPLAEAMPVVVAALVGGGVFVGVAGTALSVARFLRSA